MQKFLIYSLLFAAFITFAGEKDIANRTWDKLTYDGVKHSAGNLARALSAAEKNALADEQLTLCMIGDSVTWAEDGDYFRKELLQLIPALTFAGTHSAVLGYAHAGEGGDSSYRILQRINDKNRIPDAPYYHLMVGVNDASAAKVDSKSSTVAKAAVERIVKIVNILLKRPGTRKVFLGSILPSPFGKNGESTVRERTGSVINDLLRKNFNQYFPDGNVVWIEYEKPLRANLNEWKLRKNLKGAHPTKLGYKWIAGIAAPVMKKAMVPEKIAGKGKAGVEVVNLWQDKQAQTLPLIPGWYTLSFVPEKSGGTVNFTLYSVTDNPKAQFKKTYKLKCKDGERMTVNFFSGYQNFGYTIAPFKLQPHGCMLSRIMIEKTRPLQQSSVYGTGTFIDTVSPVAPGERLFREP